MITAPSTLMIMIIESSGKAGVTHARAPSAGFDAQLSGAMDPTVTRSAGPMYLKISCPPIRGL